MPLSPLLPTYVRGYELLPVIHVVHGEDTLAAEVVVIGVHGQKQHVWGQKRHVKLGPPDKHSPPI